MNRFLKSLVGLMISKENVDNAILMMFSIEQVFILWMVWCCLLGSAREIKEKWNYYVGERKEMFFNFFLFFFFPFLFFLFFFLFFFSREFRWANPMSFNLDRFI